MRLRDRRATLAALVLFSAYVTFFSWAALQITLAFDPTAPVRPHSTAIHTLLWLNLGLMIWRGVMRALFVGRAYGWRYGLGAIPRTFVANIIAIMAARRALFLYARSLMGKPLLWDKTHHRFPDLRTDP